MTNSESPDVAVPRRLISNITETTQWDVAIPASLFMASAICWVDPSMAPSIQLALLALAAVFVSPVTAYFTKPATERITETLKDATTLQSTALTNTLKESVLSCLLDDDLHDATLITLQTALIKASENEIFRSTALDVVKQAFTGALNDETFVRDLMASIVGAIVTASKEDELTHSVLDVVTKAVSQALADENFVAELRGAVKDTLADADIHKACATGMVSAVFPNVIQKSFRNSKRLTES